MTIVRRESLAEQAADLLLARIGEGEWALGDKLPGETTLAPQLGVGRSTAREAIRMLAGRGVLATRQGAGVFVTATEAPTNWAATVQRADILAVIDARTAIEVEAATLAAERHTDADLVELHRALEARAALVNSAQTGASSPVAATSVDDLVEADTAFHRGIVAAAHSPILLELFDGFAPRSRQAMVDILGLGARPTTPHGNQADHDVHERIAEAIASRDAATSASLTRAHLGALREQLR